MAIESTNFFSFLKQTRSPIGLVDLYNLSEIYDSQQRDALRNLLLDPEGLDQISGLTKEGLQKEDLRLIGGLEKPVINSLSLFDQTDNRVSFDLSTMIRVGYPLGEPGKHSFISDQFSDNLIVLHGGLAAKNIEYDFIDENGEVKTTSVSTSRESLFNSQSSGGKYVNASYPGLLRVRRRSHINTLKLNSKLFVEKSSIIESPAAKIKIPVYMRTSGNTSPSVTLLESFATKNSPFVLPIKVTGTGSFAIGSGALQSNNYYFGYEIKRKSDLTSVVSNTYTGSKEETKISVSFNLNGTVGNGVECFLYIYCAPSIIKILDISGLGLQEDAGKDIGLVGFDNLEELDISGNNLSTIPTWLKVNYKTLKILKTRDNSFWNNGIVSYFDYQSDPGVVGAANMSAPVITASQILSYSGYRASTDTTTATDATGKVTGYDGTVSTIADSDGTNTAKFIEVRKDEIAGNTPCVIDEANGFRVFTALTELNIGSSFRHHNADFSKVFPNIKDLVMDRPNYGSSPKVAFGLLPRLKNNSELMSYNVRYQKTLGGNIKYVGAKTQYNAADSDNTQFIGQFKMRYWNSHDAGFGEGTDGRVRGGICTNDNMIATGKIPNTQDDSEKRYSLVNGTDDVAAAWSAWLDNTEEIEIHRNDIAFNIAEGETLNWKKLKTLRIRYLEEQGPDTKVVYNAGLAANATDSFDIITSSAIRTIDGWRQGWGGRMFSIKNAPNLQTLYIGSANWEGYEGKYLLPENFAINATSINEQNQLRNFQIHSLKDGYNKNLEFRSDDFLKLGKVRYLEMRDSYYAGRMPAFVNETVNSDSLSIYFKLNKFYDISSIGTNFNNRLSTVYGPQGGWTVGGQLLPNFKVVGTNSRLYNVQFWSSLYPRYIGSWYQVAKRNKPAWNMLYGVTGAPSGVTEEIYTTTQTWTSKDEPSGTAGLSNLLESSASFTATNYLRTGDIVLDSGNNEIGRVLQIRNGSPTYIYISEEVNVSGATLKFKRAGQDISAYFNNCTNLRYLYLQNCSLTGTIPNFVGNYGRLERIRFSSNLLTTYQLGTLQNITGAAISKTNKPNLREFDLSYNALTKESIRRLISDAHAVAVFYGNNLNPITINVLATKADLTANNYVNWTEEEIFTEGTAGVPGVAGDPEADPPVAETPAIPATPDPLLVKYNQLGDTYPKITFKLN